MGVLEIVAGVSETIGKSSAVNFNTIYLTALLGALAYFIKRTMNGTSKDLEALKVNKVDESICILREEVSLQEAKNLKEHIQEVKTNQTEVKESIKEITNILTNIRIVLNKNTWDGCTERRGANSGNGNNISILEG